MGGRARGWGRFSKITESKVGYILKQVCKRLHRHVQVRLVSQPTDFLCLLIREQKGRCQIFVITASKRKTLSQKSSGFPFSGLDGGTEEGTFLTEKRSKKCWRNFMMQLDTSEQKHSGAIDTTKSKLSSVIDTVSQAQRCPFKGTVSPDQICLKVVWFIRPR